MAKLVLLMAMVAACGQVKGTPPTPDGGPEPGTFTLSVADDVGVLQGGSANVAVQVARGADFTEAITITVEGLPANVTANDVTIPATETDATVVIETTPSAAQGGPTSIVVRGTGGDVSLTEDVRLLVRGPLGSPDTSFNTTGATTPAFRTAGLALQPDGAVLVTGNSNNDVGVQRFTATGAADAAFGSSGLVVFPVLANTDEGAAVAIQDDGKVVIAGNAGFASNVRDTMVARLDGAGALDAAFGTGGKVTVDLGNNANISDFAQAVVVQSDGKIVTASISNIANLVLARFDATGAADTTFGTAGRATFAIGQELAINAMVLQPDGKLLVAGKFRSPTSNNAIGYVSRILDTGALDPTFGTTGRADFLGLQSSGSNQIHGITLASDGKILVAGTTPDPGVDNADGYVMRLQANGAIDGTFNGTGFAIGPNDVNDEQMMQLIELADGSYLGIGVTSATGTAYTRHYMATGAFDAAYGQKSIPGGYSSVRAAVTADGRVVIVNGVSFGAIVPITRLWLQ